VQTVPCTPLHGIGADEVMVSGHLPQKKELFFLFDYNMRTESFL